MGLGVTYGAVPMGPARYGAGLPDLPVPHRRCGAASMLWTFGYLLLFRTAPIWGLPPPPPYANALQLLLTLKVPLWGGDVGALGGLYGALCISGGSLWVALRSLWDLCGSLWGPWGPLWIPMGSLWVPMGLYGVPVCLCGSLWGLHGSLWVSMGFLWVSMGPYGSL